MIVPLEGIPLPDVGALPDYERGFWEGTAAGELRIQRCSDCRVFRHPPVPMCPHCHSLGYRWAPTTGRGRVYSFLIAWTPVHRALRGEGADPLQHLPCGAGGPATAARDRQRPARAARGYLRGHARPGDLHARRRRSGRGTASCSCPGPAEPARTTRTAGASPRAGRVSPRRRTARWSAWRRRGRSGRRCRRGAGIRDSISPGSRSAFG